MTSLSQRLINAYAAKRAYKTQLGITDESFWDWAVTRKHFGRARLPWWPYPIGCRVTDHPEANVPYWEFTPRGGATDRRTVLFFHGGTWMFKFSTLQVLFVANICRGAGVTVRVPRYPLLPKADGRGYRDGIMRAWRECLADGISPEDVIVMGDSAGGHAGLSLYQMLRHDGARQPGRYILISPSTDLASKPDARALALEKIDPVIALASTPVIGRKIAADLPVDDPRVSPALGDYDGCPPIDMFAGELEVMRLGVEYIVERWGDVAPVRAHIGRGCIHDWPTFPTKEGHVAVAAILDIMNGGGPDRRPRP